MKTVQVLTLLTIIGTVVAFGCKDNSINTSEDCGCNGPIKSRLDNETGVIEVLSIGGERHFRIVNKDRDYYFIPCDTVAIAALYKIKKLDVLFSGDVMQFCDSPTVHLLPPIYYPIKLSNIQSLGPVLVH